MKLTNILFGFFALLFVCFTSANAQPAPGPYTCDNTAVNAREVVPTSLFNKWGIGVMASSSQIYSAYLFNNNITNGYADANDTIPMYFMPNAKNAPKAPGMQKSYWIAFGKNYFENSTYQLRIVATTTNTTVNLHFFNNPSLDQTVNMPTGGVQTITLTTAQRDAVYNNATGITKKSLQVLSNKEISLFVINLYQYSTDATNVLPEAILGTNYYHITYAALTGLNDGYTIIATEDNTSVYEAGTWKATLNAGQVYSNYTATTDRTGLNITSNKPIAYFTTNECVNVPGGITACDCLFQQLMPVPSWGTKFLVPVTIRGIERIRIVAAQNGTVITQVGGTVKSGSLNLNAGQFVELEINQTNKGCYIQSNNPVAVGSFLVGTSFSGLSKAAGDPALAWVPPIEQTVNTSVIAPFYGGNSIITEHYALLVVPTAHKASTTVAIGSNPATALSGGTWTDNASAGYSYYSMPLTNFTNPYTFSNPEGLMIMGYGLGAAESYYYMAIATLRNLDFGFLVNDEYYSDVDGDSFCDQDFNIKAYFRGDAFSGNINWYIDGVENTAVADMTEWVIPNGYFTDNSLHTVKMVITDMYDEKDSVFTSFYVYLYRDTIYETICQGDNYIFYGTPVTTAGFYDKVFKTVKLGCDSIITLKLTVKNVSYSTDTQSACGSYKWINGTTYTASNNTATHKLTGAAKNGCDSIVTLNLTIKNIAYGTDTKVACNSYTWINGTTYTASNNTATHTLTGAAKNGCDSIVTLNLTINNIVTGIDTKIACDSYTWINGVTYTASNNTATHTLIGAAKNGCDSVVTLNLTINNTKYSTDTHVACDSYTWINGVTYTASNNTATHTLTGAAKNGCDSIVTLNLTINNTKYITDTKVACNSYTWINGVTYTASNNTDKHIIPNGSAAGCDSIITLNLTISYTAYGIDTKTACDSYTWINGVTYTSSNNTDTHTIPNGSKAGCDSIVTLNLKLSNSVSQTVDATICDAEVYILNGVAYSQPGTYTAYMKTKNGCDSIVTLNLTVFDNRVTIQVSDPICSNDKNFNLILSQSSSAIMPTDYKIDFVEKAVPSGFSNFVNQQGTITSDVITVQMPENVYPDKYSCTVTLSNNVNDCEPLHYPISYEVLYPSSIMEQKWNNVIALLNEDYNGGFIFAGYQWYHNNQLLPGETQSYIYFQYGSFVAGDHYSVQITRTDGSKIFSCPIEVHAPKGEVSNTPTIVNGGEVIKISSQDKNVTVRLITVTGIVLSTANSSGEIVAPMQQGIYLLEILSGNNSNVTKIIVR